MNARYFPNVGHEEPEPVKVLAEIVGEIGIVHIIGYIKDLADARNIQDHVAKIVDAGVRNIIVDCSRLQEASPTMIESLAALPRTVRILGVKIVILENRFGIDELLGCFAQDEYLDHFVIKKDMFSAMKYFERFEGIRHAILNLSAFFVELHRKGRIICKKNNKIVPGFDDVRDDSLRLRLQKIAATESCIVIHMSGWVDHYGSNSFNQRVSKAIDAGYVKLIFQCKDLVFWSSVLIGSFTAILARIKPCGGDLVLLEIPPKFYEYLQWLGFSKFFNIKENLKQAVSFFGA